MKKIIASESRDLITNGRLILPAINQSKSNAVSPLNNTKNQF